MCNAPKRYHSVAMLAVSTVLLSFLLAHARADGPGELKERLEAPLRNAGIAINEQSLIAALHREDKLIAARAALLLGTFPKTMRAVNALSAVLEDDDEIFSVSAMYALYQLGDENWVLAGAARLPRLKDPVQRITLAGLLARAENTEGWPIIEAAIRTGTFTAHALNNVVWFDGKRYGNRFINIRQELEQLEKIVPPSRSGLIRQKLKQITRSE